jgi:hypothetical protein
MSTTAQADAALAQMHCASFARGSGAAVKRQHKGFDRLDLHRA